MARSKERVDWNRTSEILALLYNIHRKKGEKSLEPRKINPYAEKEKIEKYISPETLLKMYGIIKGDRSKKKE